MPDFVYRVSLVITVRCNRDWSDHTGVLSDIVADAVRWVDGPAYTVEEVRSQNILRLKDRD